MGLSSTSTFSVGAQNSHSEVENESIAAKFLLDASGNPIVDPVASGSQNWHVYINGTATPGKVANPNNWLIVPKNYSISDVTSFASQVSSLLNVPNAPGDPYSADNSGLADALGLMAGAFVQGGSEDLQRNSAWGIPVGLEVPAFQDAASYHLGLVTSLSGLPLIAAQVGGGLENRAHADLNASINAITFGRTNLKVNNQKGAFGLSTDNALNLDAGFAAGNAILQKRAENESTAIKVNTHNKSAPSDQVVPSVPKTPHPVPSKPEAAHTTAALDMFDLYASAYDDMNGQLTGVGALDLSTAASPAASDFNGQMIALTESIFRTQLKAVPNPDAGSAADFAADPVGLVAGARAAAIAKAIDHLSGKTGDAPESAARRFGGPNSASGRPDDPFFA